MLNNVFNFVSHLELLDYMCVSVWEKYIYISIEKDRETDRENIWNLLVYSSTNSKK